MMKRSCVFILFLFFCITVSAEEAATWVNDSVPTKIKMCWHEGAPYAASDLADGGLHADFTRTVMIEAGFEPEVIFVPWARCKIGAKSGLYDMLFSMWMDVDLHQRDFDFFNITDIQYTSFIVLNNSELQSSELKDLEGVSLALHNHGGYSSDLLNHKGFNFQFVNNDTQKLKMLARNRVDLIIGDPLRIDYELKHNLSDLDIELRTLLPPIQKQRAAPAISKNNPHNKEIIRRYNAAYKRLCKNGVLQEIIYKHGFDFQPIDCLK
jgi:polar amino acid transport system substrate-binding protein